GVGDVVRSLRLVDDRAEGWRVEPALARETTDQRAEQVDAAEEGEAADGQAEVAALLEGDHRLRRAGRGGARARRDPGGLPGGGGCVPVLRGGPALAGGAAGAPGRGSVEGAGRVVASMSFSTSARFAADGISRR